MPTYRTRNIPPIATAVAKQPDPFASNRLKPETSQFLDSAMSDALKDSEHLTPEGQAAFARNRMESAYIRARRIEGIELDTQGQ